MSDLRAPTCFSRCFKFQSEKSGPWCLPTMQHSFPKKQHSSDRLSKKGFSGQPSVVLTPSGTVILMQFSEVIPQVLVLILALAKYAEGSGGRSTEQPLESKKFPREKTKHH